MEMDMYSFRSTPHSRIPVTTEGFPTKNAIILGVVHEAAGAADSILLLEVRKRSRARTRMFSMFRE